MNCVLAKDNMFHAIFEGDVAKFCDVFCMKIKDICESIFHLNFYNLASF